MTDDEIELRRAEIRLECLKIANGAWSLMPREMIDIAADLLAFVEDGQPISDDEPLSDEKVREIMSGIRRRVDGAA